MFQTMKNIYLQRPWGRRKLGVFIGDKCLDPREQGGDDMRKDKLGPDFAGSYRLLGNLSS